MSTTATTSTNYGDERDRLAHALATLLAADEPTIGGTDTRRVLQYRDMLLTSLTSIADEVLGGAANVKPTLGATATTPARALRTTLHSLPCAGDPAAPTDVLQITPRSPHARTWRTAASAAMLAADALAAGQPATWRADPNTGWAVMADTAAAAHALAVLDRRLATHPTPHLSDAARQALHTSWHTGLRLVASEVSRLAHTQPLADHADHLARPPALRPFPLTDTTQLTAGYQHTLRLLQARDGMLPIRTLGHLLIAQARIGHTLADHCQHAHAAGIPGADHLAQAWRQHATTAETLATHRRAVTGLNPTSRHPALTQAGEVLRTLHRLPAPTRTQHDANAVHTAQHMLHTARRIEHTIAAGIERSFTRDLYLVPNEHTSKVRGRHPWISIRHNLEPHPLLTAARQVRAAASPVHDLLTMHRTSPPARHELGRALNTVDPIRNGTPARSLQ
jgi:hypothetical protein